jgi:hypothetical protein
MKQFMGYMGSPFIAAWLEIRIAQQLLMNISYGILIKSAKVFMGYMEKSVYGLALYY